MPAALINPLRRCNAVRAGCRGPATWPDYGRLVLHKRMVCGLVRVMAVQESRPDRVLLQALQLPAVMGIDVGLVGASPPPAPYRWLPARIRQASSKMRPSMAASFCAKRALSCAGYPGVGKVTTDKDGSSIWPQGWTGSIGWAELGAVAVAAPVDPGHWLGVDISAPLTELQRRWLQPLLATRAELEVLRPRADGALSLLYSAKEALQRALQPLLGQIIDYQAVRCIRMDSKWLWFEPVASLQPHWLPGKRIRVRYLTSDQLILTVVASLQQTD